MAKLSSTQLDYARKRISDHFNAKRGAVPPVKNKLTDSDKLKLIESGVAQFRDDPLDIKYGVNITAFFKYPKNAEHEAAEQARVDAIEALNKAETELLDRLYLCDTAEVLELIKTLS